MSDHVPSTTPPGHRYRLLTGPDDATCWRRVSVFRPHPATSASPAQNGDDR